MGGRKAPEADRRLQILEAAFFVAVADGLDRLTVRKVAARAGLSSGSVFFHFATKELLLLALLDLLLERAIIGEPSAEVLAIEDPVERMLALARQELGVITERRPMLALFFDYWALGHHEPAIRARIKVALARYRAAFLPLVRAAASRATDHGLVTEPEQLSAAIVALIEGSVVQEVVDPDAFDVDGVLRVIENVVRAAFATPALKRPPPRKRAPRRAPPR
jgi:TetR/AcrR family transcriptional regulator, transcriptional repressor of bet genes